VQNRNTAGVARLLAAAVFFVVLAMVAVPRSEAQGTTVVINEIQPSNGVTLADGDGDFSDWIELYNTTSSPIDLTNWQIADAAASWVIPAGTVIPADGYLLIWASDKGDPAELGFPGPAGELHTNFKLSSAGDSVTLRNTIGVTIDEIVYTGPIVTDASLVR